MHADASILPVIGIIGNGKMGKDILNLISQFGNPIRLICRTPEAIVLAKENFTKQIVKRFKRGYMDEAQRVSRLRSFCVSTEYSCLADCDIVIETVVEDPAIKAEVIGRVAGAVRDDCVIATNTSSIPFEALFHLIRNPERCIGIHFFYPLRIIEVTELNCGTETSPETSDACARFISSIGKHPYILSFGNHMVLTKLFTVLITKIYNIYEEDMLSIGELDDLIKSRFLSFGLFEIIDSTGVPIILQCLENFSIPRFARIYAPFYKKGKELIAAGFPGGDGKPGIAVFEAGRNRVSINAARKPLGYEEGVLRRLQCLLLNEVSRYVEIASTTRSDLENAVREVFGLTETLDSIENRIGLGEIRSCLTDELDKTGELVYQPTGRFSAP